jgi:hypothetical protein
MRSQTEHWGLAMSGYATAVGWGAFVLCAMVGWGSLFYGALGLRGSSDWSRRAAAGFAFSACIGGVVDLTAVISRWLIIGFLAVGGIAFVHRLVQYAATTKPMMRPKLGWRLLNVPVLSAVAALLALRIAGSVIVLQPSTGMQLGSFNTFDDFQAYIVYPLKMLDTGSMGADPFSPRRTPTHALGGGAFLQTFVLAALPLENLRLLDVGLGTLLVIGLLWSYMGRMGLTAFAAAAVILVFLAIPPPLINVTAVLIPLALFLSLFLIFEDSELHMPRLSRAALIGLHVAAICVLKTSLTPAALGFVGVRWALALLHSSSKREAVLDGVMWFIAAGIAILPWLLDSYRWTGTLLPEGLAAYGADPSRVAAFQAVTGWRFFIEHLKELPLLPYTYLVMLVVVLLVVRPKPKVSDAFWSLLAGAAIGTAGVVVAVAGAVNDTYRFMYAFAMGALLVALIQAIAALTGSGATGRTKRLALLGVSVATVVLVLSTAREAREMYSYNLLTVRRALRGEQLIAESVTAKYRNLQNTLPQKAVLLEHMDYPFLFDFRRNRILIDDQPGSASLAPGQPFFAGGEALANYLVLNGIQYVAYDYATEAGVRQEGALAALVNDDRHPSAQAVVRLTFDFHKNLMELGRTRQRIFDDGTAFAVDLLAPSR